MASALAAVSLPAIVRGSSDYGVSAGQLERLDTAAAGIERLRSVVVMVDNTVVFRRAYRGSPTDQPVNVKSVSKSLVSTLVGAAQQSGFITSVSQTLGELAPDLIPETADSRVADLSLQDLLTMRAGLERVSGRAYGRWVNSDNWIRYALTRPFVDQPGGRMLYSTGDTHVLGAVLSEVTGLSLHALANRWLGEPLGIQFPPWTRDPQGYYLGGNEMALSPEHLVQVGALYLNDGVIDGERVLPEGWVSSAFTAQTRSPFSGDGYGYGWFLRDFDGIQSAYARGFGGQVLHVVPARSLTVAITSDPSRRARSNGYMQVLHDLVDTHLLNG